MLIVSLQKIRTLKISMLIIIFVLLVFFIVGCASKTLIKSQPEGAVVYVDNVRKGITPFTYSDTALAGSTVYLKLKKEGYKDFETLMRKNKFKIVPCIGGAIFLFPYIWLLGYPDEYEFELEKLDKKQSMIFLLSPKSNAMLIQ